MTQNIVHHPSDVFKSMETPNNLGSYHNTVTSREQTLGKECIIYQFQFSNPWDKSANHTAALSCWRVHTIPHLQSVWHSGWHIANVL
jgi:hypothetical protein